MIPKKVKSRWKCARPRRVHSMPHPLEHRASASNLFHVCHLAQEEIPVAAARADDRVLWMEVHLVKIAVVVLSSVFSLCRVVVH